MKYKCGHNTDGMIILDDNELSILGYLDWIDSVEMNGTKEICFDCWCSKNAEKQIEKKEMKGIKFKPGDIIEWCDEQFEILEVDKCGNSGKVKQGQEIIRNFKFNYEKEVSKLIKHGNNSSAVHNTSEDKHGK